MAGEDKLTPSGLEKITYKQPGWNYILDRNFDIINNCLSKVANLLDVNATAATGLKNGVVLGWKVSTSKWEPMYPFTTSSTTTSSSSTSSSSSSSTTTTTP